MAIRFIEGFYEPPHHNSALVYLPPIEYKRTSSPPRCENAVHVIIVTSITVLEWIAKHPRFVFHPDICLVAQSKHFR